MEAAKKMLNKKKQKQSAAFAAFKSKAQIKEQKINLMEEKIH